MASSVRAVLSRPLMASLHRLLVPPRSRLSLLTTARLLSLSHAAIEQNVSVSPQTADTVLMVAPKYFNLNLATATDNIYQTLPDQLKGASSDQIVGLATKEFEGLVSLLRGNGVRVLVVEPLEEHKDCTDAVFPNNWVSFHEGKIALYPMMAENRRRERRMDVVESLCRELRADIVDYSPWENQGMFLEGTGSMVLDRTNRLCYACLSQRTHPEVLVGFCRDFGYTPVAFEATQLAEDGKLRPVYHTNVICSVGDGFVVLCTELIREAGQRKMVLDTIRSSNKELVDIDEEQVFNFAGNILQLSGPGGERLLVMSSAAYESFRSDQLASLRRHVDVILHVPLPTIESLGGGGARCMLGEVFTH
ncbi:hypothetical protein GBAR_LOCUS5651 [Geodia barretti]|uniref:Amidinotransferase n=1 Tax=Geodia barretti TaxID=519541 RepID=A0AA35RB69_GEOBA|nr:hypothetical protein GBAR_LOCUS5651 [Geodia barretti]